MSFTRGPRGASAVPAILPSLLLAACAGAPSGGLVVPADRPILDWTGTAASDANARLLPAGFTVPDEHACSADPTREYVGELFTTGIDDIEVDYHWAPIVPGPTISRPTLEQPEISVAGTAAGASESTDDFLPDHPFGLDVNSDMVLDAPYEVASFQPGQTSAQKPEIHTEIETGILPGAALGYQVANGDRLIERGAWVLDCGHAPYDAEMHPPSFYAAARATNAVTTRAMAVYVPYRSSLLFTQDVSITDAFSDDSRFTRQGVQPFPQALVTAVTAAVLDQLDHISTHALMVANRFDTLSFLVCAPLPRPAGATLDATWRFTARTGVQIDATPDDPSGCVRFVATMGADYAPAPLAHVDAPVEWATLSAAASAQAGQTIDVRQEFVNVIASQGIDPDNVVAVQETHPPQIDAYPALTTRAGADQDAPTAIDTGADDQPYPFYGRVKAQWKI